MSTQSRTRNSNKALPSFSLDDYTKLLTRLTAAEYQFRKISQMDSVTSEKVAYLRHDIDFHLFSVEQMAKAEASLGITATYYVLLTQYYNPLNPDNQRILLTLRGLGHEIGLHYDLETYPDEPIEAKAHLEWEMDILSRIVDMPIRTIATHLPYKRHPDPFLTIDRCVHPNAARYQDGLVYVSDSCRAWRDESLLNCFGPNPPPRLLLTIHPELWLDGTVDDRMIYMERVLRENAMHQYRDFFDKVVREVWLTHPAPQLHDKREQKRRSSSSSFSNITSLPGERK